VHRPNRSAAAHGDASITDPISGRLRRIALRSGCPSLFSVMKGQLRWFL
jgi:hypothetical protein